MSARTVVVSIVALCAAFTACGSGADPQVVTTNAAAPESTAVDLDAVRQRIEVGQTVTREELAALFRADPAAYQRFMDGRSVTVSVTPMPEDRAASDAQRLAAENEQIRKEREQSGDYPEMPPGECARPGYAPAPSAQPSLVYLPCLGARLGYAPVNRDIPLHDDAELLAEARVQSLIEGPTRAEETSGFWWPADRAALRLGSVEVADGVATIDFSALSPSQPGAQQGEFLLAQALRATVALDPRIHQVVLTLNGDCLSFALWSGGDMCG